MPVKSIAECSIPCSKAFCILQYFRPSLNYHLSLRPLLCLFFSGRLRQVLLYVFHLTSGKADMECHICLHVWSLKTCFSICMHLTRDKTDMGRHVLLLVLMLYFSVNIFIVMAERFPVILD